jgi:hypothetical protein
MKNILYAFTLILISCLVVLSCSKDDDEVTGAEGPSITSFSPNSGAVGTNVFITGKNFDPKAANNVVKIGETKATVTSAKTNELFIKIPEGATTGKISVTVNGKTDTGGTFTITETEPDAISLNATDLTLYPFPHYAETLEVTSNVGDAVIIWSSNDTSVATVDENGLVTPISIGTAIITATDGVTSAEVTVNVSDGPITALTLSQTELEAKTLDEPLLTISTLESDSQITPEPIWTSDNEEVAIVDDQGGITALSSGTATITVTVDNASASAILTVNPGIFVGGYTEKNDGEYGVATVWQNGFSQEISQVSSYSTYIAIDGPNLYATHVEYGEGTRPIKVYRNNTLFETIGSPEENNKGPKGIQVIDGEVHICGFEVTDGTQYAKYWVNGQETLLSEEGQPASAQGLALKDGTAYIAGRVYTNTHNALYWVDGNTYDLTENVSSNTYDIFVDDNNDVYVAGHMDSEATIWKNTELLFDLDDDINSTAAQSVVVKDNVVYATGVDWSNSTNAFWIDGQLVHEWEASGGAGYSDITVHEEKIYVASSKLDPNTDRYNATVWVYDLNGQLLEELDYGVPGADDSFATSILVK